MSEFFLGQIVAFAGNFAQLNFMLCDGRLLAIQSNTALFSLLGTTYGGNGTTTFALPDLRGSVVVSPGQGPGRSNYDLGEVGGTENVTLNSTQMPVHTHAVAASVAINANDNRADVFTPGTAVLAQTEANIYAAESDGTSMNAGSITSSVTIGVTGGNQAFPNQMPYQIVNYVICVQGIFPQRP